MVITLLLYQKFYNILSNISFILQQQIWMDFLRTKTN